MAELIVYDEPERNGNLNVETLVERFGIKSDQPPALDQPYDPDPLRKGDHVTIRRRLECQGYSVEQYGCGGRYMDDLDMNHDGEPDGTAGIVYRVVQNGDGTRIQAMLKGHVYIVEWPDTHGYRFWSRHTRSELDRR